MVIAYVRTMEKRGSSLVRETKKDQRSQYNDANDVRAIVDVN